MGANKYDIENNANLKSIATSLNKIAETLEKLNEILIVNAEMDNDPYKHM